MKTVTEQVAELIKATTELRQTIREAHEARSSLRDVLKESKRTIAETIEREVTDQIGQLAESTKTEMNRRVAEVVDDLAEALHARLGLT